MGVTVTFKDSREELPRYCQDIIYLRRISDVYGASGFDPRQVVVEYVWEELEVDVSYSGNAACFNPETDGEFTPGDISEMPDGSMWKLLIILNGVYVDEDHPVLWITVDDYWNSFDQFQ